jgi:transcriptional regulator with XRE-family HTH domain
MLNTNSQAPLNHIGLASLYHSRMSIGARLRKLREDNKLSGDKFGELMGVTKGMVSQWEADQGKPSTDRLLLLRAHIDFSFDWLLYGESVYATNDPKLVAIMHALEDRAEYVKDAATAAVLTTCELAERAKANGTGTHG